MPVVGQRKELVLDVGCAIRGSSVDTCTASAGYSWVVLVLGMVLVKGRG